MARTNYTAEERQMIKAQTMRGQMHTALVFVVLAGIGYALYNDKIDLGQYQRVKASQLNELGPRIKYVLQHSTPGLVWLLFCFFYVVSKRVGTPASLPTSGNEHLTEVAKNIFLNSLEQFVMLFGSQLVLVTYLTGRQALNVIPTLNLLFIVGRILFFLGYPRHRGFGFALSFAPLATTIIYLAYRYVKLFTF